MARLVTLTKAGDETPVYLNTQLVMWMKAAPGRQAGTEITFTGSDLDVVVVRERLEEVGERLREDPPAPTHDQHEEVSH